MLTVCTFTIRPASARHGLDAGYRGNGYEVSAVACLAYAAGVRGVRRPMYQAFRWPISMMSRLEKA